MSVCGSIAATGVPHGHRLYRAGTAEGSVAASAMTRPQKATLPARTMQALRTVHAEGDCEAGVAVGLSVGADTPGRAEPGGTVVALARLAQVAGRAGPGGQPRRDVEQV